MHWLRRSSLERERDGDARRALGRHRRRLYRLLDSRNVFVPLSSDQRPKQQQVIECESEGMRARAEFSLDAYPFLIRSYFTADK